jgi:hypothetical protein
MMWLGFKKGWAVMTLNDATAPDDLLSTAVGQAFDGHKPNDLLVSIAGVLEKVRDSYPDCALSRGDLIQHLGDYAASHGFNVHFDAI